MMPLWLLTRRQRIKRFVRHLRKLGRFELKPMYHSIHENMIEIDRGLHIELNKDNRLMYILEDWPGYSGDYVYPVKIHKPPYAEYISDPWVSEYGKQCRDLCLHIAQYIEDELL